MNIPYDRRGLQASPSNPERPRWVQASGTGLGWVQSPTVEGDRGYTSPYAVGPMVNQTTGNAVLSAPCAKIFAPTRCKNLCENFRGVRTAFPVV